MVAAYDKGVKNLISGLNATGHVTHTQHRKDMVTVHHNGGRLSHEGVLNVWKTREASAHFDVDASGSVAQYVEMNEYAWACGSTNGNQRSISIEMCNEVVGGSWPVSTTTWRAAARLAGWLFAKVIGVRPSNENLVPHHHWKATTCAGGFMDGKFGEFIAVAQQAFDFIKGGGGASSPSAPPISGGLKSAGEIADEVIAGKWGNNPERANNLRARGYNPDMIQAEVNRKLSGFGSTPAPSKKSIGEIAQEVLNGVWGNGDDRRNRLQAEGYNFDAVQSEVNRRLGAGAPSPHRLSIDEIARQVIAGQWGNQPQRQRNLEGAGYNYAQVRAAVNRLV